MIESLSNDIHFDASSGTLITAYHEERKDIGKVETIFTASNVGKIKYWGGRNHLPEYREKVLMDNNIMGELIATKRAIILGQGLKPYREEIVDEQRTRIPIDMPAQIEDWMEESFFYDTYLEPAANDLFKHGNIFSEFRRNKGGQIGFLDVKESKYMRISEKDRSGNIRTYWYCPDWKNVGMKDNTPVSIPSALFSKGNKFMYHTGDYLFNDGYYCHPAYWGGKEWIELSNIIPKFHKANLDHGYNIRYHIQIPKTYFLDKRALKDASTETEKQTCYDKARAKKQEFLDKMNAFLAGVQNAGRAVYTTFDYNRTLGKEYPGIKIEAISADLKDESLLKLFEKSNQANISSQGIHPTLANVESQGKLSSGSEMRNAFNFYIAVKAPFYRRILKKPFQLLLKLNGWDQKGVKWDFEDITLAKLDEDKSGTQNNIPQPVDG